MSIEARVFSTRTCRAASFSASNFSGTSPYPCVWKNAWASSKCEADRMTGFVVCPDWNSTSVRAERSVGSTMPTTRRFPSNPMGRRRRRRTVSILTSRCTAAGTSTFVRLMCCIPSWSERAVSNSPSVMDASRMRFSPSVPPSWLWLRSASFNCSSLMTPAATRISPIFNFFSAILHLPGPVFAS